MLLGNELRSEGHCHPGNICDRFGNLGCTWKVEEGASVLATRWQNEGKDATTSRPDLTKEMGFWGAKFPLPYGPANGDWGMRENIAAVKKWREAVGPDFPLMIDCYISLTLPYSIELACASPTM